MGLHGVILVFLFAPLHECIHATAFRSPRLNTAVAELAGVLLLLPPRWFRCYHLAHHRHAQDPARDPELAAPALRGWGDYLLRISGLPYWRDAVRGLLRRAAGHADDPFVTRRERPRVIAEARAYLALYAAVVAASVAAGSAAALTSWLVPAVLGQPALRLFLMAEHTGCELGPDWRRNTRTTRTTALMSMLCWRMNWHAEHHLAPAVPFHALPALHRKIREHLAVVQSGYAAFHRDLLASLGKPSEARTTG